MMKAVIIGVCMGLSACSWIPTTFDNVGYNNIVVLQHKTIKAHNACDAGAKPAVLAIQEQMSVVSLYASHTRTDVELAGAVAIIGNQIGELAAAYENGTPSTAYCKIKTGILQDGISAILTTAGHK